MRTGSRILIAGTILTILVLTLGVYSIPRIQAQPIVSSFNLPNGETTATNVLYSNNSLWVLGYETGYLYRLSVPGLQLQQTIDVTGSRVTDCCSLFGMALLNGDLWITKRFNSLPGNPPPGVGNGRIYRVNVANGTVSYIDTGRTPELFAIIASGGFLWFTHANGVSRLDPSSLMISDVSGFTSNMDYVGLSPSGSAILVTSRIEGALYSIDPITLSALRHGGLHAPIGVTCCVGNFLYVAEQGTEVDSPSISRISLTALATTHVSVPLLRSAIADGRVPYGVAIIQGFLVWSSSSNAVITIEAAQPIQVNTGKHAVYSLSSDGTSIFFSFAGSTGAGQVKDWQPRNCETKGGGTCKK